MVSVFHPLEGPTYRDMVPEPPPAELAPSCAEAGVLGVLPGIVGTIQALETIKVILGLGEPLIGRILSVDTTDMSFRTFNLAARPDQRGHLREPRPHPDQRPRRALRPGSVALTLRSDAVVSAPPRAAPGRRTDAAV